MEIRDARTEDLAALDALERQSFAADRLSLRSMRRLVDAQTASLRVAEDDGAVGYYLTLFRRGTAVARLYSIAVARTGVGIGAALLADAERIAHGRGCRAMRLEVRTDNKAAISLYERSGYRRIGVRRAYYADKTDALRYEKQLVAGGS